MLVASRSSAAKSRDPVRLCLDHMELRECCLLEGDHFCSQGHVLACQGGAAWSAGVPPAGKGLWAAACSKEPVCVCTS